MKPEDCIKELIAAISTPSQIVNVNGRAVIQLKNHSKPVVFILHKGVVGVWGNMDQLLIRHVKAPAILGLNALYNVNEDVYMQATENITYELQPLEYVIDIIEKKRLWREVSYSLMFNLKLFTKAYTGSVGGKAYDLICFNLKALLEEKPELREKYNACDYIVNKTHISRSRVMMILSDLRTGGYIEIKRGVLLKINDLPQSY